MYGERGEVHAGAVKWRLLGNVHLPLTIAGSRRLWWGVCGADGNHVGSGTSATYETGRRSRNRQERPNAKLMRVGGAVVKSPVFMRAPQEAPGSGGRLVASKGLEQRTRSPRGGGGELAEKPVLDSFRGLRAFLGRL
jgi:hypothetical protein